MLFLIEIVVNIARFLYIFIIVLTLTLSALVHPEALLPPTVLLFISEDVGC